MRALLGVTRYQPNYRSAERIEMSLSCSCINHSGDMEWDDEPIVRIRTSKRNFACFECNKIIRAGEKYEYFYGLLDGTKMFARTCQDCLSIIENLFCDYTFGHVIEDLQDHIIDVNGDISETAISKLTPAARAIVCEMIEKALALIHD